MKLLFDQNISRKILPIICDKFPDSVQVYVLELQEANDMEIWDYAKRGGYTIVTRDSDFHELSLILGILQKSYGLDVATKQHSSLDNFYY